MYHGLLAVLAVGVFFAADAPKDDATKKELEKFQGTWKFVSLEVDGNKLPEEGFKDARLVITGDKFTVSEGRVLHKGVFKVDVSKKPKTIDVTFTEGPEKGNTVRGIYELEGDTYKVCMTDTLKARPTEFASKPGSGHVLEVLKREKR